MTATAMTRDDDANDGTVTNGSLHGFSKGNGMAAMCNDCTSRRDESSFRSISSQGSEDASLAVSFFGIALGPSVSLCDDDELPLVFSDRKEALRCARKYKGARFKALPTREDAVAFCERSVNDVEEETDCATVLVGEKPSAYKNPKSQDVVRLRKVIECGDADTFRQCVWSNPRYLVSSGDTPTIMQEGFRYNALHVACMRCQPTLLKLILETIEDPKFLALMYPDDTVAVRSKRTAFLVDLYLNMPDKGRCETPLHFACKFGCAKSVEILLNHPQCDRTRVNKFGQTAREMICERSPDGSAKEQIDSYFEDRFFVPVIRSDDNSVPPSVGTPFSPEANPAFLSHPQNSPRDPSLVVAATVGPMSPSEARRVYKTWKTPPRRRLDATSLSPSDLIRLSDPEKGLERVGRNIAKELNLPWNEFWPFLGTWCDLSTPEGQSKLESHLRKMHVRLLNEQRARESEFSMHTSSSEPSPNATESEPISPMSELCLNLGNFHMGSLSGSSGSDTVFSDRGQELQAPLASTPLPIRGAAAGAAPLKPANQNVAMEIETATSGEPWVLSASHMVAQNMISVLYDAVISGKDGAALEQAIGSQLADQVLTDLGELERSLSSLPHAADADALGSPAQFHGHLARLVSNGLKDYAVATEQAQLCFTLKSYLSRRQSAISPPSTDDEDDEAPARIFRRPLFRRSRRTLRRHLQCVLRRLCTFLEHDVDDTQADDSVDFGEMGTCTCSWPGVPCNGRLPPSPRLHLQLQFDGRSPLRSSPPIAFRREENGEDMDMEEDVFHTPPSSWAASSSSSAASSEVHTPDEGPEVFMQGRVPTKVDLDVFRALETVSVDPILYPCLYQWKQLVLSFPEETKSKWQTPCAMQQRRPLPSDATPSSPLAAPSDGPLPGPRRPHRLSHLLNTVPRNLCNTFSELGKGEDA
ncbi:ankyrin repeat and LEM domain-containing protein 2-like [Ornithodoros turicata]|uniref:ankyrin repeat and LEM domain-containing protein 2-like n=1 Tax=Ornithodoros turicata TaxID=34597 RepID=UPI0031389373